MKRLMSALLRLATAGLAGLMSAYAMPPRYGPWFFLPLGIAALYALARNLRPRFSALVGLAGGIGYFLPLLQWMEVVGTDAWIAVTLLCAFWWCLTFAWLPALRRLRYPVLAFATVWTGCEVLRDTVPWGGFGWGQFGVSTALTPFEGLAPNVGQLGATWLFILVGVLAGEVFATRSLPELTTGRSAVSLALIATTFAPFGFGLETDTHVSTRISLVQGGVDHYGLGSFGDIRGVLRHHAETTLSHRNLINSTDLVVWPENAADSNPQTDTAAADIMNEVTQQISPPILLGAIQEQPDNTLHNISLLWSRIGWQERYIKRKVVPFGEFMPFRDFVTALTDRAALMPRDFSPGMDHGSVESNGVHLGILICFEVADTGFALMDDPDAAAWIVHTNNATYQFRGQSEQQLLAGQMRAAETGRPFIIASTSGISAIIDAHGHVSQRLTQTQTGVLADSFSSIRGKTGAMWIYPWLKAGFPVMTLGLLIAATRSRRKVTE